MARKEITTVHLERQAHGEARERLRLAYEYLIAGLSQAEQPVEKEAEPIPNLRRAKDENQKCLVCAGINRQPRGRGHD